MHRGIKRLEPCWQIAIMGWSVYFINYFLRYNYSAAMVVIGQTEDLDIHEMGLIASILFATYGFGQFFSGFLGDRLNPKALVFCGILGSTASNVLMGVSSDISVMRLAWGLNGISSSLYWGPIVQLLSLYVSKERLRGTMRVFSYCTAFGQAGTYLLTAWLIARFSWRLSFFVPAVMGGLSAVGWLIVSHTTGPVRVRKEQRLAGSVSRPAIPQSTLYWRSGLPLILFAILLMGILQNGLLTWLPQMTMDSLHIEAAHAVFLSAAIPLMNSTSVWMLKGIERHSKSNDMVNCGRLFACSAVGMLLIILLGSFLPVANIVFYALVSVLATGINTILISYVPCHYTESGRSSTIAGLTNSAAYLGSALSGWGLGFAAGNWGWECVNGLLLALCLLGFVVSFAASLPWRRFIDKKRCPNREN